jgi:hypothetical protein
MEANPIDFVSIIHNSFKNQREAYLLKLPVSPSAEAKITVAANREKAKKPANQ